ncbi:MAG: type I-E CRISPR-associated endoribonuclease Cas2e [Christensenellales bacterium]|jgi:CRISPR-associated protein Cas2
MIVITLANCPPALRGDLTKWLQEISTGVYVGQVSARVRDEVWERIKDNAQTGNATMVYSTNNEQRMDFRVHNTGWQPIDFDGLKLMLRPRQARLHTQDDLKTGFSNAAKIRRAKQMSGRKRIKLPDRYIIVDVETTGLSEVANEIIEIGAIKVTDKIIESSFHALVKSRQSIPPSITTLTGITDEMLHREGRELSQVMPEFLSFAGDLPMVSHNIDFDFGFLRAACEKTGLPLFSNQCVDTLSLARRTISDAGNYKLSTLIEYFGIKVAGVHRSADDCLATKLLYEKLIEILQPEE